jgi:Ca2+/H+ antiporter
MAKEQNKGGAPRNGSWWMVAAIVCVIASLSWAFFNKEPLWVFDYVAASVCLVLFGIDEARAALAKSSGEGASNGN